LVAAGELTIDRSSGRIDEISNTHSSHSIVETRTYL
jgi:hypothetical protein